jgi:NAD-dependent SIR2 family protein deacetylase
MNSLDEALRDAAETIRTADSLMIGAGAGMGVDSGLPDFRGDAGFWTAYPPFRGQQFHNISTPHWFDTDPPMAWGFFGHRLNLYRDAAPHAGYAILRRWMESRPQPGFVFTSNVDGHFERAGFDPEQIVECHGSIHHLQCTQPCRGLIWPSGDVAIDVDGETIRARSELPRCPHCDQLSRPNILMFNDWGWRSTRSQEQFDRYLLWAERMEGQNVVAIELGAGLAIPTVRIECEERGTRLIRINPREAETGSSGISLPLGALEALQRIDSLLASA